MVNKSGKAKSKTRYTNVDKIINDSASDHSYDSKMEAYIFERRGHHFGLVSSSHANALV